jgi:hypothetical protein
MQDLKKATNIGLALCLLSRYKTLPALALRACFVMRSLKMQRVANLVGLPAEKRHY